MNYKIKGIDIKRRNQTIPFDVREDRAMLGSNLSACTLPGHNGQKSNKLLPSHLCLGEKAINPWTHLTNKFEVTGFSPLIGMTFGNIYRA